VAEVNGRGGEGAEGCLIEKCASCHGSWMEIGFVDPRRGLLRFQGAIMLAVLN
jgi:hypothetical protein